MELAEFKARVQGYCRAAGYKQERLAKDIGMDPSVFSNKLNGRTKNAPFTHLEIKGIIKNLAEKQAISSQSQAKELLALLNLSQTLYKPSEWQTLSLTGSDEADSLLFEIPASPSNFPAKNGNGFHPYLLSNPATLALPTCPYRGLDAFREEDAAYFFGRETFVEQLTETLDRKALVAVVGPSGSGKSSVVFAGLVPQLRSVQPAKPEEQNWQSISLRPGNHPVRALATALLPFLEGDLDETDRLVKINKLSQNLFQGELSWLDVLERIAEKSRAIQWLLVIDQFEELYTLCQDPTERQKFLDGMLSVTRRPDPGDPGSSSFKVVFTLRADFWGYVLSYRPLADALQGADIKLGPLNRAELQAIIEKPALRQGVRLEDGLTERILVAVDREPGTLPLVEFTLTQLWPKQTQHTLTHAAYTEIGGIEAALANHAEEVYTRLSPPKQGRVQYVFTQLVRPGEGTEDTRRVATRAELGEDNWQIVRLLADARLVVTGQDRSNAQEVAELAHEILIGRWERLQGWLELDRSFRLWQEQLRGSLHQWEASQRDTDALLRGTALAQAEDWLDHRENDLSQAELEFIEQSLEWRNRTSLETGRRRRRVLTALAIGSGILFVLALLAFFLWQDANRQRLDAEKQQQLASANLAKALAAQGRNYYADNQLELGLLVSQEALRLDDTPITRGSLLDGLVHNPGLSMFIHGHSSSVEQVAFSLDGRLIASASADRTVRLWDAKSGKAVGQPLTGHTDLVLSVAFSPDGKLIASAGVDKTIRLWDTATGQPFGAALVGHTGIIFSVAFSPDGKLVASGSDDGGDTGNGIEAEYMASEALKQGVPVECLVLEKRSHSTVENLRYSKQILQLHGWQSVILVSDPYHLYRARQQAKDQGIKVTGWWPALKSPDWQRFWGRTSGMVRDALSLMIYESLGWLLYR